MKAFKDVSDYIAKAPKEARSKLKETRAAIKSVAPYAAESMSYGMAAYDKGQVAWFGLMKNHIGLYMRPPVIAEHKKELASYTITKSAVHLPLDKKLPIGLIKKLVRARIKKNGLKKVCSRGHSYSGSNPCPVCWPGQQKQRSL